ncbi:MAG: hypothetical protein WBC91_23530 [Phototrophicaceae bacterium]
MYPFSIILVTCITFILYVLFALTQLKNFESKSISVAWILSLSVLGLFLALNIIYANPGGLDYNYIQSFIHFDVEGTLSNTFSAILLFLVSIIAMMIILLTRPSGLADLSYWLWLLISILFGVVAYDEYFNPPNLHGQQFVLYGYVISGIISALCLFYIVLFTEAENKWRYYWVIGGLGLIGVAGVLLDNQLLFNISSSDVALLEEVLEVLGIITVLIISLAILHKNAPKIIWIITAPFVLISIVSVVIIFLFTPSLRNTFEYYLDNIQIDGTIYSDNAIELIGYSFPPSPLNAGDVITGNIYFRVNTITSGNYSFSAHLLSLPDLVSVAQQDSEHVGAALTYTWIPDMIVKQAVYITIPDNIEIPSAYTLAIRLWSSSENFIEDGNYENWQEQTQGLGIATSPNRLIGDDFVDLNTFVIMPINNITPLQTFDSLSFINGIELFYNKPDNDLLASDNNLSLLFQWRITNDVRENWQQIIHLQNVDTSELFIFDRSPFDARIPSSNWFDGFIADDNIVINIPDGMPRGTYQLLTGLYNPETLQRLNLEGNHPDNIAIIDTIVIE